MSIKKKFKAKYTLTFHVEAKNEKEAGKIGQETLLDYFKNLPGMSNTLKGSGFMLRATLRFTEEIIELEKER